MGERFIVRETRGYPVGREGLQSTRRLSSSFAVLDTLVCHREIAPGRFYHPWGFGRGDGWRRRRAEKLARELNEWDRAAR